MSISPSGRPSLSQFSVLVDEVLDVESVEHAVSERWRLASCAPITRPDLSELAGVDCFKLEFECPESRAQGSYRITIPDGDVVLFAVPVSPTRMHAVIN